MNTSSVPPAGPLWARDREPRWGPAGGLAVVLVLAAFAWAPVDWLRAVFGREFGAVPIAERFEAPEGIRLLPAPAPAGAEAPSTGPRVERPAREAVPPVRARGGDDSPFVGDPTTPYDLAAELRAPVVPDSVRARGMVLRALAQGGIDRAFAHLDTTRVTAAARRFDWMDAYMNDVLRPRYEAEGRAARIADIYRRAVTEAEEEGM